MRFIAKFAAIIFFSLLSHAVFANQATGARFLTNVSNWVGTASYPNEALLIKASGAVVNPARCSDTGAYLLPASSQVSRSMVLAAFTAQLKISLNIYGGGCGPAGRPLIVSVDLMR